MHPLAIIVLMLIEIALFLFILLPDFFPLTNLDEAVATLMFAAIVQKVHGVRLI